MKTGWLRRFLCFLLLALSVRVSLSQQATPLPAPVAPVASQEAQSASVDTGGQNGTSGDAQQPGTATPAPPNPPVPAKPKNHHARKVVFTTVIVGLVVLAALGGGFHD